MDTLTVNKSAMRKYIVMHDFTIGQADLPVRIGDELWYTKGMMEIYGQSYRVNILHVAYRRSRNKPAWIELADGQEPDPVMERLAGRDVVGSHVPHGGRSPQSQIPQQQARRPVPAAPQVEEGIDSVNGVEVLPENWAELHWTHKRAYVIKMRDVQLLQDMAEEESEKMQKIIKDRVDFLKQNPSQPFARGNLSMRSDALGKDYGTPVTMQKPQLQVEHDNVVIPTSFGDTTDYIDMTKTGKSTSDDISFDASITADADNMSDFSFDS